MPEVVFKPRYAIRTMNNPDADWLRALILDPFRPGCEFGEAIIEFRDGDRIATLILIVDRNLGCYLNLNPTGDAWLSLGDPTQLSVVVCPDDWEASAGLFVAPNQAWLAISEFWRSGCRSAAIEWIRPRDLPADGNW